VKGSVELDGHGDAIEIADVSGTVTVHGEYSGAIQFRGVGQTLRFESQRTDMTAQKLSGRMDMEVGSLDVDGIDGLFDITTRQKDITVNEFKHSIRITDSNGQIRLQTSSPLAHDIEVESEKGGVEVTLPPNSNFQIEARSHHSVVECDFSGPGLKVVKEGDTPSISGTFGRGGPMILINTESGAIRVLRIGPQPPKPPSAPGPREPPGKAHTTWNRVVMPPYLPVAIFHHRAFGWGARDDPRT
jgi:DUF4097 and DUF4098 domain-containing protein YvlB